MVVVARYQAQPGKGDEVASILAGHLAQTRAEPGCVSFLVNGAEDDGDRFVLYEQYADEAAFEAHRSSPHFRENVQDRIVPLLEERHWERYRLVGPVTGLPARA